MSRPGGPGRSGVGKESIEIGFGYGDDANTQYPHIKIYAGPNLSEVIFKALSDKGFESLHMMMDL